MDVILAVKQIKIKAQFEENSQANIQKTSIQKAISILY